MNESSKKNTPKLWDTVWQQPVTIEEDIFNLVKEENNIRWQRIEQIILSSFKTFENLKVIEIGAGSGTIASLMAKRGAKVTILDYSDFSLKRSKEFFSRNNLSFEFIKQDALNLSSVSELTGKFDISMSFGLAEHFIGTDRLKIIQSHFDLLNENGITFISVPNKLNPPYRLYKFVMETFGKWLVEEYPFSRRELRNYCKELGVTNYFFFGDSIFWSLNWIYWLTYRINPIVILNKITKKKRTFDISSIKKEKGTIFDQYISYALVLCARK